jgi:hypothetical protein
MILLFPLTRQVAISAHLYHNLNTSRTSFGQTCLLAADITDVTFLKALRHSHSVISALIQIMRYNRYIDAG